MTSSTDIELKRDATACIDSIIEKYGKRGPDKATEAIKTVAGGHCLGSTDSRLCTLSLLSIGTAARVLGEAIISVLPQAMPSAIDHLERSILEDHTDERLHNAFYSFLEALLLYLPWIITGPSLDRILRISQMSANAGMPSACEESRVKALSLIAKQANPQDCLAAMNRTWETAMIEGPEVSS